MQRGIPINMLRRVQIQKPPAMVFDKKNQIKEEEIGLDKYMDKLRTAKMIERAQEMKRMKPIQLAKNDIIGYVVENKPSKKELIEILKEI